MFYRLTAIFAEHECMAPDRAKYLCCLLPARTLGPKLFARDHAWTLVERCFFFKPSEALPRTNEP
uniref:Uncharacterized protein n=1 Tax=Candidatus Kentrum sp. SD TaxID=2126332 RepID=A0A450YEM7_9GAMM|nr:MAG: hypothetical protein BECKSD772F_GA0070984_10493 [Candidatus Kentron sp. SD]VFK45557.1 MAG: hypothetical protein BECKSD772E_GA0070983_10563 [Candidatus Kentron sp. SD]VFK79848.1 MAG: hypothetical protein BECKSD772D_GA0070982_106913 [Candidatus Kentron sp. SD]